MPSGERASGSSSTSAVGRERAAQYALETFPKAPLVHFPVESTSLAITSVCDVLAASDIAAILVAADRMVKFVTEEARRLLGIDSDQISLPAIEATIGLRIADLTQPLEASFLLGMREVAFSLVPLSGSAAGAVLVLKPHDAVPDQTPFANFIRETVLVPLRSLHESLSQASQQRRTDPVIDDAVITMDQILSSLELAANVDETTSVPQEKHTRHVSDIVRKLGEQFRVMAERKGVTIKIDSPLIEQRFEDEHRLRTSLQTMLENALHYVPQGGQIVLGARLMEHKERPLLLFFVMDNGPIVPEEYRKSIFDPGFVWDQSDPVRTGKGLARCRQFAIDHGGQVWVESKSGKACTFFLRVAPA
ncbi:MAG TPA: HAMP domain-containing sensor histidine kinase [Thermoanaerobaculia bacterium]|nr:HAMP domain-containing sensor histidine kinase [Thermoanaerobaculia bacterium]